ncbi:hypothetical protein HHK36_033150 [Tetracentron sinense]|uniref:Uncharacterized protein n=1 Tax=Tetracentron sinense TaxID=13715 RepID=A0A834Y683_TETSI|nr:hypothetical protein HHK36_033150 [Tetracentron sinense]
MSTGEILLPARVFHPQSIINLRRSQVISISLWKRSKRLNCSRNNGRTPFVSQSFAILRKSESDSASQYDNSGKGAGDDFVTRVLKENPSQVEPRFLVGNKFYTLQEKENLNKGRDAGVFEILKRLYSKTRFKKQEDEIGGGKGESSETVYLKDILREYKGKLYVPEQVFGANLSEEEEFDRDLEELPKMSFEDFQKSMKSNKVKLLTSKAVTGISPSYRYRDFIVGLKEIPGDKSLQRTKWAMKLSENEAQVILEEYTGPQYEIERHTAVIDLHFTFIVIIYLLTT